MDLETLFTVCVASVLPAWLLMICAPGWKWTQRLLDSRVLSVLLAAVYTALILAFWRDSAGDFSSLAGVAETFQTRGLLLAGWVHYLAFDLLIGAWELQDSQKLAIPHALLIPFLILTFVLGPMGFLAYCLLRRTWK